MSTANCKLRAAFRLRVRQNRSGPRAHDTAVAVKAGARRRGRPDGTTARRDAGVALRRCRCRGAAPAPRETTEVGPGRLKDVARANDSVLRR